MLKSVLQPPFETTPLAAPQPDRHVKTLAERASEQRALYLARPNSVNHRSLWSAICDERHCCYDATRKGGLAHRRAAAAAPPPSPTGIASRHKFIGGGFEFLSAALTSLPPSLPHVPYVRPRPAVSAVCFEKATATFSSVHLPFTAVHYYRVNEGCTFYINNFSAAL